MREIKLKPCPFCGGEAGMREERRYLGGTSNGISRTYIQCNLCACRTMSYDWEDKKNAIKTWNTRKPMEAIVERLEEKSNGENIDMRAYYGDEAYLKICEAYEEAIEIVKEEGGVCQETTDK